MVKILTTLVVVFGIAAFGVFANVLYLRLQVISELLLQIRDTLRQIRDDA